MVVPGGDEGTGATSKACCCDIIIKQASSQVNVDFLLPLILPLVDYCHRGRGVVVARNEEKPATKKNKELVALGDRRAGPSSAATTTPKTQQQLAASTGYYSLSSADFIVQLL